MDYNLDVGNRDNRRWGTRKRVTEALSPLGITALEWVCLEERLEGLNPERIWSEIQFLGMNLRGVYMPEATLELVQEARVQVDKMGVVRVVDQDLASQMVSELQSYGEDTIEVESLIGTLILSDLGIQAWMAVKEALGYFYRFRFIKLLEKSHAERAIVFHSLFPYDIKWLCEDCAQDEATGCQEKLIPVGPWYMHGKAWLRGWRLICPHMRLASAEEVQASWRSRGYDISQNSSNER